MIHRVGPLVTYAKQKCLKDMKPFKMYTRYNLQNCYMETIEGLPHMEMKHKLKNIRQNECNKTTQTRLI